MYHLGRVSLSEELLLSWLHYEGGRLRTAVLRRRLGAVVLELMIEHPDMPGVEVGEAVPEVTPTYRVQPETYTRESRAESLQR